MRRIKWIRLLTVIFTLLLAMSVSAQDKELTLQELIPGGKNYSRFVPKELKQLNWCGERYFYVKGDYYKVKYKDITSKKRYILDNTEKIFFCKKWSD